MSNLICILARNVEKPTCIYLYKRKKLGVILSVFVMTSPTTIQLSSKFWGNQNDLDSNDLSLIPFYLNRNLSHFVYLILSNHDFSRQIPKWNYR